MKYMLITNNPVLAHEAEDFGVQRIFVDLEINGKHERQGHLDTLISSHTMDDVPVIRAAIKEAELLVRLNPLYAGTADEVEAAIAAGADLLMLPYFHKVDDLKEFSNMVGGRAGIIPLVETHAATRAMAEIVKVDGLSEIYIGLNDLHLDMGLNFMFEPLVNGLMDELAGIIRQAGIPFGFGGIARVGEGVVPGEMVLGEHLRLGSSSVILSRTFHRVDAEIEKDRASKILADELGKLIALEAGLLSRSQDRVEKEHEQLSGVINNFVKARRQ
ncbi:MAG: aldolase [Gammaproteobacteria bacterium]|nr:aldolase [Gammaproteobacteria bacterium]